MLVKVEKRLSPKIENGASFVKTLIILFSVFQLVTKTCEEMKQLLKKLRKSLMGERSG